MTNFHFFYDNLADILSRDDVLKDEYLALQEKLTKQVCDVILGLKQSQLIEIDDDDVEQLAHTVKLTVSFWTPYVKTHNKSGLLTQADIYQGLCKVILLFKPYTTTLGKAQFISLQGKYTASILASKINVGIWNRLSIGVQRNGFFHARFTN